jgi:hypothetical protein
MSPTGRLGSLIAALLLLFAAAPQLRGQTATEPYNYAPVTIVAGGYVPGFVAHPSEPGLIYARTDIGSVYRWDHNETAWTPLTDFHSPSQYNLNGPESIALDPNDPNRLYIASGMYEYSNCCAFLVSDNRGATFQTYSAPFEMCSNCEGRSAGERLAVNPFKPNELFMGTRLNGLWVSENRAQTWTQVTNFPVTSSTDNFGVQWVLFDPKHPGTIYVGAYTTATVYISPNDGATWSTLPGQPLTWPASYSGASGPPAPDRAILDPDGDLYVTFDDQPGPDNIGAGLVEKYDPSAKSWTNITPPIDAPYQSGNRGGFVGITEDPRHPGTVAVSTVDRWYPVDSIYLTDDGGSSWTNLGLVTSAAEDDGPPYGNYYFNTSVYTPISPWLTFGDTNYPNTPDPSAKFGWWISGLLIDPTNPDHLIYGTGATIFGTNNLSAAYTGNSPTWSVQAKGVEETAIMSLISPTSGAHLLSGMGDIGGFRHTQFQVSPPQGMYTNPVSTSTNSLDWAGQNPNFIVRVQTPGTYSTTPCNFGAYSTDNGANWTPFPNCASGGNYSNNGGVIAVDASGTSILWTTAYNPVQFSLDDGNTWTAVTGLPYAATVYADKVTPQLFYGVSLGSTNTTIYSGTVDTAGDAAVFSQVSSTLPASEGCYGSGCGVLTANFAKSGDLWLPLGSNGLYHSTDGGVTWTQINVAYANSVAVGAPSPWTHRNAVFLYGQTSSSAAMAIYRSDDDGQSWIRINDDRHQYGGPTLIQADTRVFGRVYLGMNGRGIVYGDPALPIFPWF